MKAFFNVKLITVLCIFLLLHTGYVVLFICVRVGSAKNLQMTSGGQKYIFAKSRLS